MGLALSFHAIQHIWIQNTPPWAKIPHSQSRDKNIDETERDKKSYHSALSEKDPLLLVPEIFHTRELQDGFLSLFFHFYFISNFLFLNSYGFTGSCRGSTEKSRVSVTEFPQKWHFPFTIAQPQDHETEMVQCVCEVLCHFVMCGLCDQLCSKRHS